MIGNQQTGNQQIGYQKCGDRCYPIAEVLGELMAQYAARGFMTAASAAADGMADVGRLQALPAMWAAADEHAALGSCLAQS